MCGVVGIVTKQFANQLLFEALTALQHRGQDAAGMMTYSLADDRVHLRKGLGLVRDVVRTRHMKRLLGPIGIGHVRYPTAGVESPAEAQPFYVNSPYGLALAHNGNLTNATELERDIIRQDKRHLNTDSDSELLLNIFAHELQELADGRLSSDVVFAALVELYRRVRGAYAAVIMIAGFGIVGFRDPHGIRPLVIGKRETAEGVDYMLASESAALSAVEFEVVSDVAPGEAVIVTLDGELHRRQCVPNAALHTCLFEYVYLARPDSCLDGASVYQVRAVLGEYLADQIKSAWPDQKIDVVMPIPDTSRPAAHSLAERLGLPYREGFVKNRYIGRTFIMPGQQQRRRSVRQKLNTIDVEFAGKRVLLVDDSIVRGTTSGEIVAMARDAGAKEVYFASAAPPVRHPNVYGIDMPSAEELIAHDLSVEQIAEHIGADGLIYQELSALEAAVQAVNPEIKGFEASVFDGNYITGDISADYLRRLAELRADAVKQRRRDIDSDQVDVINLDK